ALRGLGALTFEHALLLDATRLSRLANGFFACPHLRLAKRGSLGGSLLPRLVGLAIALDALDVALVHQQPFAEAICPGDAQSSDEPCRPCRCDWRCDATPAARHALNRIREARRRCRLQ